LVASARPVNTPVNSSQSGRDERGERTEPVQRPGCDHQDERGRETDGDDPGPKEDVIRRADIPVQELAAEREFIGIGPGLRVRMEFEAHPEKRQCGGQFGQRRMFRIQSPVAASPIAVAGNQVRRFVVGLRIVMSESDLEERVREHQRCYRAPEEDALPAQKRQHSRAISQSSSAQITSTSTGDPGAAMF
jgi:hypothetical protein